MFVLSNSLDYEFLTSQIRIEHQLDMHAYFELAKSFWYDKFKLVMPEIQDHH